MRKNNIKFITLMLWLCLTVISSCSKSNGIYDDMPEAKESVKYLKKNKFINTSFSDRYDLYVEFKNDSIYHYYALSSGSDNDTITNNGKNCSFWRNYSVDASGNNIVFDGPKSKWVSGAYHTPLGATIDRELDQLNLTLYLEYHKANPKTRTIIFNKL